jgi:hypothetical protein
MVLCGHGNNELNMVPCDYVLDAIHYLATQDDTVGQVRGARVM